MTTSCPPAFFLFNGNPSLFLFSELSSRTGAFTSAREALSEPRPIVPSFVPFLLGLGPVWSWLV